MNTATLSPEVETALRELVKSLLAHEALPEGATLVPSSCAAQVVRARIGGELFFMKVFLPQGIADRLKQTLRGSRASRAKQAAQALHRAGFYTPPVVLAGEAPGLSWMVTRAVPGIALGLYLDAFLRGPLSVERLAWKRRILLALGELAGRLHGQGFIHGDLRLNNILIDAHAPAPVFYLVDNERNRCFPNLPPRKLRIKNLVQLSLVYPELGTRTDRQRFFRTYWGQLPSPGARERQMLVAEVEEKSRLRLGKLARKPLQKNTVKLTDVSNVPS